jgi:ring-1,2-phenylacetyl-CoA epoxidase subunit PaaE
LADLESFIFFNKRRTSLDIRLFNACLMMKKMKLTHKETFIDVPDTNDVFLCGPEKNGKL